MATLMLFILLSCVPPRVSSSSFVDSSPNYRDITHDERQAVRVVRYLSEVSSNIDDDDDDDDKIVPETSSRTAGSVSKDVHLSAPQGEETAVSTYPENDPSSAMESKSAEISSSLDDSRTSLGSNQFSVGVNKTDSQTIDPQNGSNNALSENKVPGPPLEWPDDDDDDAIAKTKMSDMQSSSLGHDQTLAVGDAPSGEEGKSFENEAMIDGGEAPISVNDSGVMEEKNNGEGMLPPGEEQQAIITTALGRESDAVSMTVGEGNSDNNSFSEGYSNALSSIGDDGDRNFSDVADSSQEPINSVEPLASTSAVAYHRNESDQEGVSMGADANIPEAPSEAVIQGEEKKDVTTNEQNNDSGGIENPPPPEGGTNTEIQTTTQFCQSANNCIECINLAFHRLRSKSTPCYWIGQCISAQEALNQANPPSGPYKCADDGSAVYTGEGWDAALNAVDASNQVPVGGETKSGNPEPSFPIGSQEFYYDDEEEYDLFEMAKTTFNVILLAAVIAMVLLIRKRVINRLRDDSSLDTVNVVMEEVMSCIVEIGRFVSSYVSGARGSNSASSEYRPVATSARSDSYERRTVPLSTAADEEWGWGDEDTSTHLELPGIGVDDTKEEEELALAIAMSLSESANGTTGTARVQPNRNSTPKPVPRPAATVKPKPPSSYHSRAREQKPSRTAPQRPASTPTKTLPQPSNGDSIDDLLGKLNPSGGSVITGLAQKPQNSTTKSAAAPKKQDGASDDIFASMGFSSFSSKPSAATAAPRSTPLPSKSLAADTDLDADWGDDDLNDLLDD